MSNKQQEQASTAEEERKFRPWHEVAMSYLKNTNPRDLDRYDLDYYPNGERWALEATIAILLAETIIPEEQIDGVIKALIVSARKWDKKDYNVVMAIADAIRTHDAVSLVQEAIDDGEEDLEDLAEELGLEISDED